LICRKLKMPLGWTGQGAVRGCTRRASEAIAAVERCLAGRPGFLTGGRRIVRAWSRRKGDWSTGVTGDRRLGAAAIEAEPPAGAPLTTMAARAIPAEAAWRAFAIFKLYFKPS
jgi:hypothetical protein